MIAAQTSEATLSLQPPPGAIEAFLHYEAALLDQRRYEEWLELFADEAIYWLPLEEGQGSGADTVSIIYDDRRLLETRVRRLRHPRTHAQLPVSRTCHFITNVVMEEASAHHGTIVVHSNQMVAEYRNGHQRLFIGHCRHELIREAASFKIGAKRLDLIDSEGEHRGISIIL